MIVLPFLHPLFFIFVNYFLDSYTKTSLIVNIINHVGLTYYALQAFLEITTIDDHHYSSTSVLMCGEWLLTYMIYDLCVIWVLTKTNSIIYTIHHVAAILLLHGMMVTGKYHYYFPVICMFEFSSIPLNIRYLLKQYNVSKESWLFRLNDVVFVVSFAFIRLLFGGRHVSNVWQVLQYEDMFDIFLMIIVILFSTLHLYWGFGILKKTFNLL